MLVPQGIYDMRTALARKSTGERSEISELDSFQKERRIDFGLSCFATLGSPYKHSSYRKAHWPRLGSRRERRSYADFRGTVLLVGTTSLSCVAVFFSAIHC